MAEGGVSNDLEMRRRQLANRQMSTLASRKQHAVCVRRAHKHYGSTKNPAVILDGLNMTVPKGSIYGLLGASGCGKTTLLSCIVGRKRLNSGEIWVLGGTPGSKGSGVPGPRIGYMPQEIALYGEFTIRETMLYFGWISDMTTQEIDERLTFLLQFLMLPGPDRQVKTLSGGQQRRVSLSAALLHEPELLILDEPTVGVDPMLRQNIWDHLLHITKGGRTTVIITTHYIDETRQAHMIGLMRGGYLLAEESPERLVQHYHAQSLEDVFLKLSVIQNMGKTRRSSIALEVTTTITVPSGVINEAIVVDDEPGEISGEFGDNVSMSSRGGRISIAPDDPENAPPEIPPPEEGDKWTCMDYLKFAKASHLKTLIWKNFLWMWRNYPVMLFITVLPVVQTVLFCLSIGHDPQNLPISVMNYELEEGEICMTNITCSSTRLSCNFLKYLEDRTLQVTYCDSVDAAKKLVEEGNSWAALVFQSNFSDSLRSRIFEGRRVSPEDVLNSEVSVFQDISNENIGTFLKRDLYFSFEDFFRAYLTSCDINDKIGSIPIRFNEPIYGYKRPNFTDFAAPGVIITIVFFLSVALTCGAMLLERNEGILERSLVNGITSVELLFAHVVTQFTVMAGQTIMVVVVTFAVFDITMKGPASLTVIMTGLTGLCGMCFGFVVATICDNERTATYLSLGSFLPIVMLCGIIWPIEGMHYSLQTIAYVLPLTKCTESLRYILAKGWTIDYREVYTGFISISAWIFFFLILSILLLKFKKG
ncbi:PREDICTED: ABC transporter G family member 20 [Nicrophorus vespilloides]|uniref:ABC transporter G family member 20 n=1 Tax=Nicrophorus vespilloides TaxID=110193 RepID=A0ABM1MJ47_NICVS|nr:PREDICTED: ABC transporter G family member 20 [Nicrophorus vespilloides]